MLFWYNYCICWYIFLFFFFFQAFPSSPMLSVACRGFQTSSQVQDVDSAAKFIGAGAATVGVAGQSITWRVKPLQLRKGRVKKKKTDMKAEAHLVTLWHYGNCTIKCWAAVEQAWIQSCQCLGKGWLEIFYVAYFICLLEI